MILFSIHIFCVSQLGEIENSRWAGERALVKCSNKFLNACKNISRIDRASHMMIRARTLVLSVARPHFSAAPQLPPTMVMNGSVRFLSSVQTAQPTIPTRTISDDVLNWESRAYFMSGRSVPRVPTQHLLGEYKVGI